jgi:hypothetical protein
VEEVMGLPSTRPSFYTLEEGEGHGTLGNDINFVGRDRRSRLERRGIAIKAQTAEAMPRRHY